MSRNFIGVLMAAVVLNSLVVASTLVWSNTANSTGSLPSANGIDFDYVFAAVANQPRPNNAPAAAPTVDFDKAFGNFNTRRPEDTPPNRERLRNVGWRQILEPL
jgi:hypothetical protein